MIQFFRAHWRPPMPWQALIALATLFLIGGGLYAVKHTPLDALPDLSDVQVIVYTDYPGQAPQVVEDQVTYPLTTSMLAVPRAKVVRGFSMFGASYVYVIFEDGTDIYWARSRVLEYLNQVQGRLPASAKTSLGPDATGVGWIYQYALVDRSGRHDLAQLRALQDWFLRFELKTVPNVAEVAAQGDAAGPAGRKRARRLHRHHHADRHRVRRQHRVGPADHPRTQAADLPCIATV